MPKFKKERVAVRHGTGTGHLGDGNKPIICAHDYDIMINAAGLFYTNLPEELREAALTLGAKKSKRSEHVNVTEKTYTDLIARLREIHEAYLNPEVKEEFVILFNIDTRVSFAETKDGQIYPNRYYAEDAEWTDRDARYGDLNATNSAFGGYTLCIGAVARKKVTRRYGNGSVRVTYDSYYGPKNDHFDRVHPAARLNSWNGFRLPHHPRQIPYTDEAAEFFYDLMMGMAEIARRVQARVFKNEDLLKLIDSRVKLLPAADKS